MADKKVMRLAYCAECKIPLAAGFLQDTGTKHFDSKSKKWHAGKVVDIDVDESPNHGEKLQDYLKRLLKKYVK
jgi:hypothetical protein